MTRTSRDECLTDRPPRQLFMTLRDITLWVRSARVDAYVARLRNEHGNARAFDLLYGQMEDPWAAGVPRYRYQRRKYDILLSFVPRRRYRRGLDLGCGIGEMTRRPGPPVGEYLGLDISGPSGER